MNIEIGKSYKHPICGIFTAIEKNEKDNRFVLCSALAMMKKALGICEPIISDFWEVSERYANSSGMVEIDLKDVEFTDGEIYGNNY